MNSPQNWNEKEWLVFLLLLAAHADDNTANLRFRPADIDLPSDKIKQLSANFERMDATARDKALRDAEQKFSASRPARARLQKAFLQAYPIERPLNPDEQGWVKRISEWLKDLQG